MKKFTEIAAPYIAMSWKVFPIRYGTKDRYFAKTDMPDLPQAGFYWGTDDPKMIERYERELPGGPRHNIAVRTGAASGIVVVDLDFGKGPEAQRALDELAAQGKRFPMTPGEAWTPSGGGALVLPISRAAIVFTEQAWKKYRCQGGRRPDYPAAVDTPQQRWWRLSMDQRANWSDTADAAEMGDGRTGTEACSSSAPPDA